MMLRWWIIILSFCLLAVSCDRNDRWSPPTADELVVSVSFPGIGQAPGISAASARADGDISTVDPLAKGTTVRILVYRRSGTSPDPALDSYVAENTYYVNNDGALAPCTVDNKGTIVSSSGNGLRLASDTYDFYTLTPALAVDRSSTAQIAVSHGVDYATSLTEAVLVSSSYTKVTLDVLDRKCVKLDFSIDRLSESIDRVDVKEILLTPLAATPQKVTLGASIVPALYNATVSLDKNRFVTNEDTPYLASGSALVLPRASGDVTLTMKAFFNGRTKEEELVTLGPVTLKNLVLQKGYRYTFKVKLKAGRIYLTLSITDWNDQAWSVDIGSGPIWVGDWDGADWDTSSGGDFIELVDWLGNTWDTGSGSHPLDPEDWSNNNSGSNVGSGPGAGDWNNSDNSSNVGGGPMNDTDWQEDGWNTDVGDAGDFVNDSDWLDGGWNTDMGTATE